MVLKNVLVLLHLNGVFWITLAVFFTYSTSFTGTIKTINMIEYLTEFNNSLH